jgi:branched-chain amino acid transport system permease protein
MFAIGVGLWLLIRTRLGIALDAIRMDEDAVRSSGLNTTRLKLFAFMVSAMVAGIGGALYIHYLGSIAPRGIFEINFLFTILVAALLGGAGSIVGPIIGAFFLTFLLELLRPYIPGAARYLIYGVIALVLYYYAPKGIYSFVELLRIRLTGLSQAKKND